MRTTLDSVIAAEGIAQDGLPELRSLRWSLCDEFGEASCCPRPSAPTEPDCTRLAETRPSCSRRNGERMLVSRRRNANHEDRRSHNPRGWQPVRAAWS